MNVLPTWQLAGFLALHLGAIACALGTRMSAGSRYESLFHMLFLPSLGAVGLATWYSHAASLGIGIPSGMTFMSMVLLAVIDFRRTHEPAAGHHFGIHS